MFSKESIQDTTHELRDSMYEVGKSALELESKQAECLQRKVDEERKVEGARSSTRAG